MRSAIILLLLAQSCGEHSAPAEPQTQPLISQWSQAMRQHQDDFQKAALPDFAEGGTMHTQTQAESFQLQAILQPADSSGRSEAVRRIGFITQLDRLALRPATPQSVTQSAWRYDSVVRSSVFVDSVVSGKGRNAERAGRAVVVDTLNRLASLSRDPLVQRMAMGLGGVSENSLWVGNDKLDITPQESPAGRSENNESPNCQRHYQWSSTLSAVDTLELHFSFEKCPIVQSPGLLVTWQQFTPTVAAILRSTDANDSEISLPLRGVAWLRHSWGNLPTSRGAVVIDTLQVSFEDGQELNVSRSRRRSGRGPMTVTATLQKGGILVNPITLEWDDSEEQQRTAAGITYPSSIVLRNSDESIALEVRVMNRLSESVDVSGRRLQVPVLVTGTEEGAGFLTFNSLSVNP